MRSRRPPLFRKRQFEPIIIVTCVWWYSRFSLSLRNLEELMAERGLALDHTTKWRCVQRHGPEVRRRLGERKTEIFQMPVPGAKPKSFRPILAASRAGSGRSPVGANVLTTA